MARYVLAFIRHWRASRPAAERPLIDRPDVQYTHRTAPKEPHQSPMNRTWGDSPKVTVVFWTVVFLILLWYYSK